MVYDGENVVFNSAIFVDFIVFAHAVDASVTAAIAMAVMSIADDNVEIMLLLVLLLPTAIVIEGRICCAIFNVL